MSFLKQKKFIRKIESSSWSIAVHLVADTKFGDVIHGGKHVVLHRVPDESVTDFFVLIQYLTTLDLQFVPWFGNCLCIVSICCAACWDMGSCCLRTV